MIDNVKLFLELTIGNICSLILTYAHQSTLIIIYNNIIFIYNNIFLPTPRPISLAFILTEEVLFSQTSS